MEHEAFTNVKSMHFSEEGGVYAKFLFSVTRLVFFGANV
jgi:hypothetical protein